MSVLLATFVATVSRFSLAQLAIITTTSTITACGKINTSVLSSKCNIALFNFLPTVCASAGPRLLAKTRQNNHIKISWWPNYQYVAISHLRNQCMASSGRKKAIHPNPK